VKVDACRSCSAPIVWCVSERGARAPMNAEPSPDGTFALREEGSVVIATFVRSEHVGPGRPLHTSHFAVCPDKARWRKPRK
jgi:hypothetical protein